MSAFGIIPEIAGSIAGPAVNYFAQKEANQINKDNAERNVQMQREFAQHGIRWKVEDARRAGISPLAALGASGAAFAPVHVGAEANTAIGDGIQNMGQNISRAVAATSTQEEKMLTGLRLQNAQAEVEGRHLDNQIRAIELRRLTTNPSFPSPDGNFIPGQGNTPARIKVNPSERTSNQPGAYQQDAGWITDKAYARTATGMVPVPSKDVTERIEDKFIPEMLWAWRNSIMPNFGYGDGGPPTNQLPKGFDTWKWNHWNQEYQPAQSPWWMKDRKNYGR